MVSNTGCALFCISFLFCFSSPASGFVPLAHVGGKGGGLRGAAYAPSVLRRLRGAERNRCLEQRQSVATQLMMSTLDGDDDASRQIAPEDVGKVKPSWQTIDSKALKQSSAYFSASSTSFYLQKLQLDLMNQERERVRHEMEHTPWPQVQVDEEENPLKEMIDGTVHAFTDMFKACKALLLGVIAFVKAAIKILITPLRIFYGLFKTAKKHGTTTLTARKEGTKTLSQKKEEPTISTVNKES